MAHIIDGKKISAEIRAEIAADVAKMKEGGKTPGLAVIIVGENPASKVYDLLSAALKLLSVWCRLLRIKKQCRLELIRACTA